MRRNKYRLKQLKDEWEEEFRLREERLRIENKKSIHSIKLAWDHRAEEIIYTGNTLIRVSDYCGKVHYETRVSNENASAEIERLKKVWNIE